MHIVFVLGLPAKSVVIVIVIVVLGSWVGLIHEVD